MQDFLQQENAILAPAAFFGHPAASNGILPLRHLMSFSSPLALTPIKVEMKIELMKIPAFVATFALLALTALNVSAQTPAQPGTIGPPNSVDTDRIIRAFTAKEAEFRRALNSYSFK